MATVNQPSATPTNKVAAAGIGGSITVLLIYIASLAGLELPAEVASAITAILAFAAGYFAKERA